MLIRDKSPFAALNTDRDQPLLRGRCHLLGALLLPLVIVFCLESQLHEGGLRALPACFHILAFVSWQFRCHLGVFMMCVKRLLDLLAEMEHRVLAISYVSAAAL